MTNLENDSSLRGYQDDFDTDDDMSDPVMDEREDDPVKGFGVPVEEYRQEMDSLAIDEQPEDDMENDDLRERIEDLDEDLDQESLSD